MKVTIEMNVHELARSIKVGTLEALVKDVQNHEDKVRKITEAPKVEAKKAEKPVPETKVKETPAQVEKPPVAEESPAITLEQVRAAFIAKNSKNNTPKLKAILDRFGVRKVTDLDEKDFPEVLKALEEI